MVTIAVGKYFSTGFDMNYWTKDPMNAFHTIGNAHSLMCKLLTLNVPTMCVIQGHAFAGGLVWALCHDFRMIASDATLQLTEITAGQPLGNLSVRIVSSLMPKQASRTALMGYNITSKEALANKIVSSAYKNDDDCKAQL
jgi:Delta3-Delta2-enoyl-CoA isomerase